VHETLDKNELEEEQTEVKKSNKTRKCGRKAGGYFFSSRPLYRVLTFVAEGKDEMKKKQLKKKKKLLIPPDIFCMFLPPRYCNFKKTVKH
jgi:hypothetical protein